LPLSTFTCANIKLTIFKFLSPRNQIRVGNELVVSKESLLACEQDWSNLRLLNLDELVKSVSSYLIIRAPDYDIVAELNPLEVYSADNLGELLHSRLTGDANFYPNDVIGDKVMRIGPNVPSFIDRAGLYHVAREGSSHFQEHLHLLIDVEKCSNLCRAVIKYGKTDGSRSAGQFRVNFGCGGQHMPDGVPAKLVGLDFEKRLPIRLFKHYDVLLLRISRTILGRS
jgi:hypothetical protein